MPRHFLEGLDADLKQSLLQQLRTLWAHTSTAIEGNSLTLGETHQVLTEGLTISGKPLKDHNEVVGHAKAEDLMEKMVQTDQSITKKHLFELHQAVQTQVVTDVYEPVGKWKNEPNSTVVVIEGKQIVNDTYAFPRDIEPLMEAWLLDLNKKRQKSKNPLEDYAALHAGFVRIHPFADGNGRMARLLANIPVLKSGEPPILIPKEYRIEYIRLLASWQISIGRPLPDQPLVIQNDLYKNFETFCEKTWKPSRELVKQVHELQEKRIS